MTATSSDNHLIFEAEEDESILEIVAQPPFGELILFVKQLADGRTTELLRSHWSNENDPEYPPVRMISLPGRNTGPHFVGPESQIVWTRTVYEAGSERPTSSEIWRMNGYGERPTRLIAYPSNPTRATLVTTGMGH